MPEQNMNLKSMLAIYIYMHKKEIKVGRYSMIIPHAQAPKE